MIGQTPLTKSAASLEAHHFSAAARSDAIPVKDCLMFCATNAHQELTGSVERRIQLRTHGRVRDLRVELGDEIVLLYGWAPTYYTKQLAQHGAMDVLTMHRIVNAIEVG
jgi:hypothetical protein